MCLNAQAPAGVQRQPEIGLFFQELLDPGRYQMTAHHRVGYGYSQSVMRVSPDTISRRLRVIQSLENALNFLEELHSFVCGRHDPTAAPI